MRVISSSVRAALIILALFWGNCLTCPQALMAQTHRCCHKNKQSSPSCQTQVLRQFVKADPAPHAAPVPLAAELGSSAGCGSGRRVGFPSHRAGSRASRSLLLAFQLPHLVDGSVQRGSKLR